MRIVSRTSNVFARVEPEIKEQAEKVLDMLGIPMSNAIGLFLRQVILQHGIPFDVKLPKNECLNLSTLSHNQFNMEIQKGYDDIDCGRVTEADQVAENLKRKYNL